MIKLYALISAVFMMFAFTAYGDCYQKYDAQSGNSYTVCTDSSGTTTRGYNYTTGSTWEQRNNNNGTYHGRDSNNNHYQGDNNTGNYHNYGTGKSCYGKGAGRVCY